MRDLVFHIGHHKTATSWLQQYFFSEHPNINIVSNYKIPWEDEFLYYLINTSERSFCPSKCKELFNAIPKNEDEINLVQKGCPVTHFQVVMTVT